MSIQNLFSNNIKQEYVTILGNYLTHTRVHRTIIKHPTHLENQHYANEKKNK